MQFKIPKPNIYLDFMPIRKIQNSFEVPTGRETNSDS